MGVQQDAEKQCFFRLLKNAQIQAAGSEASRSESLMKETDFYDISVEGIRSGSENRWRNGVQWTRIQAWFRVLSVIPLVRCVHAHHPV